jgi:diguanylate cyclase (GGDEF)-like protein
MESVKNPDSIPGQTGPAFSVQEAPPANSPPRLPADEIVADPDPATTPTPRRFFHLGIRQKIILILLTALLIALTANTWLALRSQERDILNESERRGREISRLVSQNLANSVVSFNYHAIELLLKELAKNEDIVHAQVIGGKGNTMAEVGAPSADKRNLVVFKQDIRLDGDLLAVLHLGLSTERIVKNLEEERRSSFLRQAVIILLVMLVEFGALSYIIIRPLGIFSRTIGQGVNAEGKLGLSIRIRSGDEFGEMAERFNRLQEQLNDAHTLLCSRIELADDKLQDANVRLTTQAEELRRMNRELELLAITDPLTGLYNRRHFVKLMENEVESAIRHDETISIILVDIDNFQKIHEQYGHVQGDETLKGVARIIAEHTKGGDVACRYGGDEFFLFCKRATMAQAVALADELQRAVADKPFRINGQDIHITLSMGVATIPGPQPITSAEEFFRCADKALFHCKQRGRNSMLHYSMLDKIQKAHPF